MDLGIGSPLLNKRRKKRRQSASDSSDVQDEAKTTVRTLVGMADEPDQTGSGDAGGAPAQTLAPTLAESLEGSVKSEPAPATRTNSGPQDGPEPAPDDATPTEVTDPSSRSEALRHSQSARQVANAVLGGFGLEETQTPWVDEPSSSPVAAKRPSVRSTAPTLDQALTGLTTPGDGTMDAGTDGTPTASAPKSPRRRKPATLPKRAAALKTSNRKEGASEQEAEVQPTAASGEAPVQDTADASPLAQAPTSASKPRAKPVRATRAKAGNAAGKRVATPMVPVSSPTKKSAVAGAAATLSRSQSPKAAKNPTTSDPIVASKSQVSPDRADRIRARLGKALIGHGLMTEDQLQTAIAEQNQSGGMLGDVVVRMGFVRDDALADVLAEVGGIPRFSKAIVPDPEVMDGVSIDDREQLRVLPLGLTNGVLSVAMVDPENVVARDLVLRQWPRGTRLSAYLATDKELQIAAMRAQVPKAPFASIVADLERIADGGSERALDLTPAQLGAGARDIASSIDAAKHPVTRFLDAVLSDAVRRRASDVHFEPDGSQLRLRLRVDGVLTIAHTLHNRHWSALSHRLKLLAGMNIADRLNPQDGRFSFGLGSRSIDVRASCLPTVHGENIVLRLLDQAAAPLQLDGLGFSEAAVAQIRYVLRRPDGMVIVCGPTGSGKTTTLYAMLDHLSGDDINVMTLEDPVEYALPMVRQSQIREGGKLTFADGIRSVLRQDPDVILVGEVRDSDTAAMAMRAAMTGHRVLTTVHANDAVGVLPRLLDLGLRPGLLAGTLNVVIAQRLMRALCPKCRVLRPITPEERDIMGGHAQSLTKVGSPMGCSACDQTGYQGRVAVVEILPITPALDALIADGAPHVALQSLARRIASTSLLRDGLAKVEQGQVSVADLARAVDMTRLDPGDPAETVRG